MEKYDILKKLGEGGFGKVFLAKLKATGKQYVVKQIDGSALDDKKGAMKEIDFLSKFSHPNIIGYKEWFEQKKGRKTYIYIAMNFADGGDLEGRIKKQSGRHFPEQQVVDWAIQICLALKHIHDRKILHRDIKSQNIFLMRNGMVKLGDFGIAKTLNSTVAMARTQIGTPYYLSPEICKNKAYNHKSDMWAIGVVLYELTCLRHPFTANSIEALVNRICNRNPPPIPRKYSASMRTIVGKLLNKKPSLRPDVNTILGKKWFRGQIKRFLSSGKMQEEFSHTVIHHNIKPVALGGKIISDRDSKSQADKESDARIDPPKVHKEHRKQAAALEAAAQEAKKQKEAELRRRRAAFAARRKAEKMAEDRRKKRREAEIQEAKRRGELRRKEAERRRREAEQRRREHEERHNAFREAREAAAKNRQRNDYRAKPDKRPPWQNIWEPSEQAVAAAQSKEPTLEERIRKQQQEVERLKKLQEEERLERMKNFLDAAKTQEMQQEEKIEKETEKGMEKKAEMVIEKGTEGGSSKQSRDKISGSMAVPPSTPASPLSIPIKKISSNEDNNNSRKELEAALEVARKEAEEARLALKMRLQEYRTASFSKPNDANKNVASPAPASERDGASPDHLRRKLFNIPSREAKERAELEKLEALREAARRAHEDRIASIQKRYDHYRPSGPNSPATPDRVPIKRMESREDRARAEKERVEILKRAAAEAHNARLAMMENRYDPYRPSPENHQANMYSPSSRPPSLHRSESARERQKREEIEHKEALSRIRQQNYEDRMRRLERRERNQLQAMDRYRSPDMMNARSNAAVEARKRRECEKERELKEHEKALARIRQQNLEERRRLMERADRGKHQRSASRGAMGSREESREPLGKQKVLKSPSELLIERKRKSQKNKEAQIRAHEEALARIRQENLEARGNPLSTKASSTKASSAKASSTKASSTKASSRSGKKSPRVDKKPLRVDKESPKVDNILANAREEAHKERVRLKALAQQNDQVNLSLDISPSVKSPNMNARRKAFEKRLQERRKKNAEKKKAAIANIAALEDPKTIVKANSPIFPRQGSIDQVIDSRPLAKGPTVTKREKKHSRHKSEQSPSTRKIRKRSKGGNKARRAPSMPGMSALPVEVLKAESVADIQRDKDLAPTLRRSRSLGHNSPRRPGSSGRGMSRRQSKFQESQNSTRRIKGKNIDTSSNSPSSPADREGARHLVAKYRSCVNILDLTKAVDPIECGLDIQDLKMVFVRCEVALGKLRAAAKLLRLPRFSLFERLALSCSVDAELPAPSSAADPDKVAQGRRIFKGCASEVQSVLKIAKIPIKEEKDILAVVEALNCGISCLSEVGQMAVKRGTDLFEEWNNIRKLSKKRSKTEPKEGENIDKHYLLEKLKHAEEIMDELERKVENGDETELMKKLRSAEAMMAELEQERKTWRLQDAGSTAKQDEDEEPILERNGDEEEKSSAAEFIQMMDNLREIVKSPGTSKKDQKVLSPGEDELSSTTTADSDIDPSTNDKMRNIGARPEVLELSEDSDDTNENSFQVHCSVSKAGAIAQKLRKDVEKTLELGSKERKLTPASVISPDGRTIRKSKRAVIMSPGAQVESLRSILSMKLGTDLLMKVYKAMLSQDRTTKESRASLLRQLLPKEAHEHISTFEKLLQLEDQLWIIN